MFYKKDALTVLYIRETKLNVLFSVGVVEDLF